MKIGYKKPTFKIGVKTERTHCSRCLRTKEEAIRDQLELNSCCDDAGCGFAKEINLKLSIQRDKVYIIFCDGCGYKYKAISDNYCINCGKERICKILNNYANI